MLRNNNNSYINCSEQQARSRSITLSYACIIIVIVIVIIIIIIISMCDSVQQCSTVRHSKLVLEPNLSVLAPGYFGTPPKACDELAENSGNFAFYKSAFLR